MTARQRHRRAMRRRAHATRQDRPLNFRELARRNYGKPGLYRPSAAAASPGQPFRIFGA